MPTDIKPIIRNAVEDSIRGSTTPLKLAEDYNKHKEKIHFIPIKYRVLGGVLQSLNIKFGNFIEKLLDEIVDSDSKVKAHSLSGKKVKLQYTQDTDSLIDQYISRRQRPESPDKCDEEFSDLLSEIKKIETKNIQKMTVKKDIDALFYASEKQPVYVEVKYNDDHDTGKFVDINRKFLKTYAGIYNLLPEKERDHLVPYIYYFNPKKRWGPTYTPSTNIKRGRQLFEDFFEIRFEDVDECLRGIGDDPDIVKIFDNIYEKIRYKL
jgi:hypothetical protein